MNVLNFEEHFKSYSKGSEETVCNWLHQMSHIVLRQHDSAYMHDFFKAQHNVFQILFGRERNPGLLANLFTRMVRQSKTMKHQFLESLTLLYQFMQQLSPDTNTNFYEMLSTIDMTSPLPQHCLPPHLQLYLGDPSIVSSNAHFATFQEIFVPTPTTQQVSTTPRSSTRSTIQSYGVELKLNPLLTFFAYLLSSLNHYRERIPLQSNDVLTCFQDHLGSRLPIVEKQFLGLLYNPVLVIVRRTLHHLCTSIDVATTQHLDQARNHQGLLVTLQKIVVLIQEYTLYSSALQLNPNELRLTPFQAQNFLRLRTSPYVLDVHLHLIYTLLLFNNQHGAKMESLFNQFAQIYLNSRSSVQKPRATTTSNVGRTFFFNAGRNVSQITFQQALYRLLSFGLQSYNEDKSYSQISLQSYVSLWVLFMRWPHARYEPQQLGFCHVFDTMMFHFIDRFVESQRRLEMGYPRQRVTLIDQIANLYNSVKWKAVNRFNYVNYNFKLSLMRGAKTQHPITIERKDTNLFSYHHIELSPKLSEFHNHLRIHYPFFTILVNRLIRTLSQLGSLDQEEVWSFVHLVSFMSAVDPSLKEEERDQYVQSNLYLGGIRFLDINGYYQQQPQLHELRSYCELLEGQQEHNQMSPLYQVFENQTLKREAQIVIGQLADVRLEGLGAAIRSFQLVYNLPVQQESKILRQQSIQPTLKSHHSVPSISVINQWQVPPKDSEIVALLWLMRGVSHFLDTLLCRSPVKYKEKVSGRVCSAPATQWPRFFANLDNLKLMPLLVLVLVMVWALTLPQKRRLT